MNLKVKIITVIALILLLVMSASTIIILSFQKKRVFESKLHDVSMISLLINQSIRDAMKRGITDDVQGIISNISENPEIISLRILSKEGEILKSKDPEEIGKISDGFITERRRVPGSGSVMSGNVVINYRVIHNEPSCYECHDAKQEVNGIIETKLDISRHKRDVASMRRFLIFSSALTVLTIAAIFSILFTKNIINPLQLLMHAISDAEKGNLEARVTLKHDDEIGVIGNAFNRMLGEIKTLYDTNLKKKGEIARIKAELEGSRKVAKLNAQMQVKVRELENANRTVLTLSKEVKYKNEELGKMVERLKRINEIGRVLSSIIETDEIIKLIIKTSAEILYAQKGAIHIQREDIPSLTLHYKRGIGVEKMNKLSLDFKNSYSRILSSGKPLVIKPATTVGEHVLNNIESGRAIGVPLKMKGKIVGAILLEEKIDGSEFTGDELRLLSTLSSHAMVAIENAWLYKKLKSNYFSTIQSLVNALEASDPYTKGHSERVRYLSVELARYIGLEPKEIDIIEHAAILHDIGKIGIDTSLLNKKEKLSHEEFQVIKSHPVIGEEILGPIDTQGGVRTTILQHHEHYNGSGYPFGLVGEEITLKARILSVADTFDAMISHRPYRDAIAYEDIFAELRNKAGDQFDPDIVDSFVSMMEERGKGILEEAGYGLAMNIG